MVEKFFYYFFMYPLYKLRCKKFGAKTWLRKCNIQGASNIVIDMNVYIHDYGWLVADGHNASVSIGNNTYIGRFAHIYATGNITIGKKVLIADNVYIADNLHQYTNVDIPIIDQPITQLNTVVIADGAWIGEKVCIIGASVGKNSVVGANSVVTKNIPDYCVAVGTPAKIIKRYHFEKKAWCKTNEMGEFI
jgi:acetyltransferase-like isoleucine patch superfamily enzyme